MSKNCISCGKNIGLLTIRVPLLEDERLVICAECFNKMPPIMDELYQKTAHPSKAELLEIKDDVLNQLKETNFNQDTINVVTKFFDDRIGSLKDQEKSESGKVLKKCPICKKNVNYNAELCSDCGYMFNVVSATEYKEIADIYNSRFEQYKKNPFYEYDYVVVPNLSDGSTDKERIKEIIFSHAIQGWRLITMYSNELGKNSLGVAIAGVGGGTNVTMCEDIMVFERCIKRESLT